MADVGLKQLLQAGVHFGHQTSRWNPKMRKYIFAERGGIYLLDLRKSLRQLQRARERVREAVESGKSVLFVCTKPQLADLVQSEAERCGAFYVTERWLGGMLTNFQTIKKNIRRLKELEQGVEEGAFDFYTKKEQILLDRERQKLERYLSGIKDMTSLPGLVFVVDANREEIAVKEAHRLEIPIVAIADTNADPDLLDIPIPGNDDAIRSVSIITRALADEVAAARKEHPEGAAAAEQEQAYTYSSDVGETEDTTEADAERQRRPRPRRRPKPEVIAQRRQSSEDGSEEGEGEEGEAAPPEVESVGEADDASTEPAAEASETPQASSDGEEAVAEEQEATDDEVEEDEEPSGGS